MRYNARKYWNRVKFGIEKQQEAIRIIRQARRLRAEELLPPPGSPPFAYRAAYEAAGWRPIAPWETSHRYGRWHRYGWGEGRFRPKDETECQSPRGAGSAPRRFLALKARGDTSRLPIARTWPITPPRCDTWSSGTSADCGEIKTVYGAKDRPTSFPTPSGRPAITGSRCRVSSWTMTTYCCFAACWRSRRDARPDARRLAIVP